MHNQPSGLRLLHQPVLLNPLYAVSRAGEFTHSPGTTLTYLHYHDSLEIGYCYEGSGVFIIDNRIIPFSAGCVSIIFKYEIHIAQSSVEHVSKWKFINLDPTLLLGGLLPNSAFLFETGGEGIGGIIYPGDSSGLINVVKEMIEESNCGDVTGEQAMKGLALCMFAKLSRLHPENVPDKKRPARGGIRNISPALDYIVKNHARPIYITELAAACGMSVTTFRRAFLKAVGIAPNNYIQNLRIQLSLMQLLFTQLTVMDIALTVGYDSLSVFNRQFKRKMGMPPSQYRRTNNSSNVDE